MIQGDACAQLMSLISKLPSTARVLLYHGIRSRLLHASCLSWYCTMPVPSWYQAVLPGCSYDTVSGLGCLLGDSEMQLILIVTTDRQRSLQEQVFPLQG